MLLCSSWILSQALPFSKQCFIAFMVYGLRLFFSHVMHFILPKIIHNLLKNKHLCFSCFLRLVYIFVIGVSQSFWNAIGILQLKLILMSMFLMFVVSCVCDSCVGKS
jgi:hypothetical protein